MGNGWDDVEGLFVSSADADLRGQGDAQPAFGAFAGERLLFLAWLRPFAKGDHVDPLIELLALAMSLNADRLALRMSARVWSLDDPIPPVSEDADLRQQALALTFVDGVDGDVRMWTVIHPYDLDGDGPTWRAPQRLDGGEGWIGQALRFSVRERDKLATDAKGVGQQAVRVAALGHRLLMPDDVRKGLEKALLAEAT